MRTAVMDGAHIRSALRHAAASVAVKNPPTPGAIHILIEENDGDLRIVATNMYRLTVMDLPASPPVPKGARGLLAPNDARAAARAIGRAKNPPPCGVSFDITGQQSVRFRCGPRQSRANLTKMTFPHYAKTTKPGEPTSRVELDADELRSALTEVNDVRPARGRPRATDIHSTDGVFLTAGDDCLIITDHLSGKQREVQAICAASPGHIPVSPVYLLDALSGISGRLSVQRNRLSLDARLTALDSPYPRSEYVMTMGLAPNISVRRRQTQ